MFQTRVAYFVLMVFATTQPIFMLRVWLGDRCGMDDISTGIGDNADGVAVGKGIRQSSVNPSQTTNINAPDAVSQWAAEILKHGVQILILTDRLQATNERLDNIPNEFPILQAKVKKLEDTEITVSASKVVIKPADNGLSTQVLTRILIASLIIWPSIIVALIYFR